MVTPKERMLELYYERRQKALEFLGGKCVVCGTTEALEIDHINPEEKSFAVSTNWSMVEARFMEELKKCQILCEQHHKEKTSVQLSVGHGEGLSGKRNCPCNLCKTRKAEYMKNYKRIRRGR